MFIAFTILDTIAFVLLLIIAGICPVRSRFSLFEIERRAKLGDREAIHHLAIEKSIEGILSIKRIIIALLLVLIVAFSVLAFGWPIGLVLSFLVAIIYSGISRLGVVNLFSKKLYKKVEKPLLAFIHKQPFVVKLLRGVPDHKTPGEIRINSRQEFQHLLDKSESVITEDHRKLIVNGLLFDNVLIKDIMVPRLMVRMVEQGELLGPLVLSDLHKSGHGKLPVVDSNFDKVIGILLLDNLLQIKPGQTQTARDAMDTKVLYIQQNQTLDQALRLMLQGGLNILIVNDEGRMNVGIITMSDLMNYLFGRKVAE